jgi:HAMP domain-containing protein
MTEKDKPVETMSKEKPLKKNKAVKFSIRTKFILLVTIIVLSVSLSLTLDLFTRTRKSLYDALEKRADLILENINNVTFNAIIINDELAINEVINNYTSDEEIDGIYIYNAIADQHYYNKNTHKTILKLYKSLNKTLVPGGKRNSILKKQSIANKNLPVRINANRKFISRFLTPAKQIDRFFGTIVLALNYNPVNEMLIQSTISILQKTGIVLLLALIGTFIATSAVTGPIKKMSNDVQTVGQGNLKHRISIKSRDEIGYLAGEFNHMIAQIQDYSEGLEQKVEERTRELKETLDKVQALKTQQDGDYFLTSLLFKPLIINQTRDPRLTIDFVVDQKKKFTFRKNNGMLGGDLCIARELQINDKTYTAFINADAMGKSVQGAGGAIIMGVVFNNMVTQLMQNHKGFKPSVWLRTCYNSFQNAFLPFDGSMYISCVTGIFENETGTLYFFNAEHPFVALLRLGKARFLEEELQIHKIGIESMHEKIPIKKIKLQKNDIIIMGSDGKDDVLLGTTDKGRRDINEDETLFLKSLETSEGNLPKLQEEIIKTGELTDDLSILSLKYTG